MKLRNRNSLTIDSTLHDLPSIDSNVQVATIGETVFELFNQKPENPGVIVLNGQEIIGVISRESFFEKTGRRFGVEVFLSRPINLMLEGYSTTPLVLSSNSKISQAAHLALSRENQHVYDPIVVARSDGSFHLIDILTIFLAENQILLTMHNQHTFTISKGLAITDEEAISRFMKFSGISFPQDLQPLVRNNSIKCDKCGNNIQFTISDVVRSHPQLDRGIDITSRMGSKTITMYIRHSCGENILEIPVLFDEELKLRSIRQSRLVETYV